MLKIFLILFSFQTFADITPDCAEVKLGQRTVLCIAEGIGSLRPQDRAITVQKRIQQLAEDYSFNTSDFQVLESDGFYHVLAHGSPVVSIGARDRDTITHFKGRAYAVAVIENLKMAIADYRKSYSYNHILRGIAYTILASLVFFILWALLNKLLNFLNLRIHPWCIQLFQNVKIKSYQLINPQRVASLLTVLFSITKISTLFFMFYLYISIVFSFFPWTEKLTPTILGYMIDPLMNVSKVIIDYIPNVFYIGVICIITHYFLRLVKVIFNEIEAGNIVFNSFHAEWAQPTFKLVRVLFYALAFVMIFPYLPGSSSPAFQGLSVFLGVVISFSSGSAIANIISGIVLIYMRPFKVGDHVKIADTVGDIIEKNFLVTRVKTIKNTDITIPNTMVLGSHIINYSSSAYDDGFILNTTVTIGYDVPWREVHQMLIEAAHRTSMIDLKKDPFVLQKMLDDFTVAYELNAYTNHANQMADILSDLHQNIQDVFNEKGVEIMSPNYIAIRDGN